MRRCAIGRVDIHAQAGLASRLPIGGVESMKISPSRRDSPERISVWRRPCARHRRSRVWAGFTARAV